MVMSIAVSFLPLVLFLSWLHYRRQSLPWPLTIYFLIFGVAAAPLSIYLGTVLDSYLPRLVLQQTGDVIMVPDAKTLWLHALLNIGPIEEFTKFLPVFISLALHKTDRRVIFFGMVLSAAAFATAESVYAATVMSSMGIALLRAFTSIPMHMGLGAMGGWLLLSGLLRQRPWPLRALLIFLTISLWHGMTDGFLLGQMNLRAFGLLAMLITMIGSPILIRKTANRLRREEK